MEPHPEFKNWKIPRAHELGSLAIKALTVEDLDRDFVAVMESADEIRKSNPGSVWPEGLTRDENLIDLAWHQKEFEQRRSFAWIIEDKDSTYTGCLYVYPSIAGEKSADVRWWWRHGAQVDAKAFLDDLRTWLVGDEWPDLEYVFRSR